ncbi:MAG TPA: prenyltransferase [Dehalococcoidia bacterium]|nr:prenyltransferase [Dehalococcoidia bacterium]
MERRKMLQRLSTYAHVVVSWVDDDGYPAQTPADFMVEGEELRIHQTGLAIPTDRTLNIIASHIRPQPGYGYDQRRYISIWGRGEAVEDGMRIAIERHWGWDEDITPFPEYVERSNPQAHRYLAELSAQRGVGIKPRLSPIWTFLLATRLPFLTATIIPILLGIAVAGHAGEFNLWLAFVTVLAGASIHIGLNVANDVFDALSGADEANYRPTQYSGGSRVIQRGIVPLARMIAISTAGYIVGGALGVYLVLETGSAELLAIGVLGVLLSVFYTAPPLRLVHRGLGELTTAIGFGPMMVLGAYVVQTGELAWEPFVASIPVAILIALVLYVNEIPDRPSDASVGKRTLPVRLSRETVIAGFLVASIAAFATVAVGVIAGLLPAGTLISLAALPLAFQVHAGIRKHYESPYELMAVMGRNVQLHMATGTLLFVGYLLAIVL